MRANLRLWPVGAQQADKSTALVLVPSASRGSRCSGARWSARPRAVPAGCPSSTTCRLGHAEARGLSAGIGRCRRRRQLFSDASVFVKAVTATSRACYACAARGRSVSAGVSLVVVTPLRSAHDSMLVGASGYYGELWSARGSSYGDLCLLARQF